MRRILIFIFTTSLLWLSACENSNNEGGTLTPQAGACSIEGQNRFVHEAMKDRYLWYREVPDSIDYGDFDSPEQTLDFLKYHELDRFSYIADAAAFSSLFGEGQYVGYGFSYQIDDAGRVWFKFVYDDSPAGRAGLARGDEILSVNGQTVEEISTALAWGTIFGDKEVGVPVSMLVRKKDGSTADIQMEKAVVNINTVLHSSVIEQNGAGVGYLVFNSFLGTSQTELEQVFADFYAQQVSKVILDLRYNGGGSVAVARDLGSLLFDNTRNDQLFTVLEQNDRHQNLNSSYYFSSKVNELDLDQLVVITTGSTASASEMIINGLKPFVPVTTVGSATYGKPVGMNGMSFCDKILLPITFAAYNADHEGDYFDGIAADCAADDDVAFDFGDATEPMLAEALRATGGQACSRNKPQSTQRQQRHRPAPSLQDITGGAV